MLKNETNILLATMQLGIGGAETHIVELAKELKRRGFNVIAASNGGDYVNELTEAGIKHYRVPMQNKNPINMFKASSMLKKIIIEEKINIVHAHARIPMFILGRLHKKMKFPFVTTAHWVFNTSHGLKYLTNWGEKTVAVSEDIKQYLIDNYQIPPGDIRVTINGIDTDKFSPDTECADIKSECGINDGDNVITYISRMDESRSLAAKQLIEIVPELDKSIPNLKVIIVGGGDDFENVTAIANRVNGELGRSAVILTGARTDINKLIAPCKLFVGVSRSALEAMAAEKPVIIAGNEGYIGLFDESRLDVGIDTNFCCRGCEESSGELLKQDILKFFALNADEQAALGRYGRELIKSSYSVARMTDDTLKVYDWALSKNKEILISGYYGFHNSGDDALLSAIIQDIKKYKESPNIVVLSASPKETGKMYGVKAISRLNPFLILKHMKNAEMLISGGGTLIQDRTSTKSLWYYLTVISTALRYNLKVMLYANGIGPLTGKDNIRRTVKILNKVDLITLRDEASKRLLEKINVTKPPILVTADHALNLCERSNVDGRAVLDEIGVPRGKKLIGISVRRWGELSGGFEEIIARACDYISDKYGYYCVFIPMQMSKDYNISVNILSKMRNKASILEKKYSVDEMLALNGCMDMCIGMRLHTLIYAAIKSIPVIGLVYDPKISSFMKTTHQNLYAEVSSLSEVGLMRLIDECVKNYDSIKADLTKNYALLRKKSEINGKLAVELYEKGSVEI
ncbi:MAG: polysaccharide pyruvyl transferase CsaB [Firmicutes bacterium]|nr:polysaccharide pyruvyl transferase CsaB [Bacillota bacterium]